MSSPEPSFDQVHERIDALERWAKEHNGPEGGKTSLNYPHTGVVYLDKDGMIPVDLIPPSAIARYLYYL
jgi:hypothetical protein